MELKFYKKATRPTNLTEGSIWFNPSTKRIELSTGAITSDVYGSDIQDATYKNNVLTITKIDGSSLEIDLSNYVSTSDISSLENSLASKLNKIQVNNGTVNSTNLNFVGGGGTTVSNSNGTITISSEEAPTTFDASAITSGTINIQRLPKGALERLFIVDSESDAMSTDCQEGDTVQVSGNNNKMYFCVNESATSFANKFHEYTAGTATSVPWSGVTDAPTIPTKTSDLTNDSGFVTSAVTSINGQTGDVTINSEPLIFTSDSVNGFASILDKDQIDEAIESNRDIWLITGNSKYKFAYKQASTGFIYYYFSYSYSTKIYTLRCTYNISKNSWSIYNSSSSTDVDYATTSTAGIVKIGSGINVSSGVISVDSTKFQPILVSGTDIKTVNGESILGSGNITISAGTEYSLPTANSATLGGVKIPASGNIKIDTSGNLSVPTADSSTLGVVKAGTNITNTNGTLSIPTASTSTAGVVKVGNGLSISNGTLSTNLTIPTKTSDLANDSNFITEIPIASDTQFGTVLIGDGLVINAETGALECSGGGIAEDYSNFDQDIIPISNRSHNLGNDSKPWYNVYATQLRIVPLAAGSTTIKITDSSAETWTFTLMDGTTVTKKMILNGA